MPDPNSIGQGRQYESVEQALEAEKGTYSDAADAGSVEDRLPTTQMPKAPDPSPFILGNPGGGGGTVTGG